MRSDFIRENPQYIQKLKKLLQTNDPANAELAFQIMKSDGVPDDLYWESINTQEKILLCLKHQFQYPLKQVKRLELATYEQPIQDFIHHLALLENLECLDLARKELFTLPTSIFQLKKLRILNLRANQLRALPPDIKELQSLRHLNLSGNFLESLPQELGELAFLEFLTLTSNQINYLPESMAKLIQLRKLVLWGNPLSKFEIEKIKSLLPHTKVELEVNNLI
ncbi:MAG: leucine-rich repeat domain-containing protein [Microscillaceae bacterium]|nr:leucine-rich repeat domain-containing protein [Microscillaceae bacterium]